MTVVVTLARLLERLDGSSAPVGADQYLSVARHLTQAMAGTAPGAQLQKILEAFPAAATLYENLHYDHAGLCRAPLEASMASELLARDVIASARRRDAAGSQA